MQLSALAVLVMDGHEAYHVDEVFVCILQPYASRKEPAVCRYTRESVEQARAFSGPALSRRRMSTPR